MRATSSGSSSGVMGEEAGDGNREHRGESSCDLDQVGVALLVDLGQFVPALTVLGAPTPHRQGPRGDRRGLLGDGSAAVKGVDEER